MVVFLSKLSLGDKKTNTKKAKQTENIKIKIWTILIFCIDSLGLISQIHQGHNWALFHVNLLYNIHHKQIPKAVSKKSNTRQIRHINRFMGHWYQNTQTTKNIILARTKPKDRANLFCGAHVYSGCWFCVIILPAINVGANSGFIITLIINSNIKKITKNFKTTKFHSNHAKPNVIIANKNNIPAPALASLSFNTGIGYLGFFCQNTNIFFIYK